MRPDKYEGCLLDGNILGERWQQAWLCSPEICQKEPSDPQYCFDRWRPWSQIQKACLGAAQGTHPWIQKLWTLVMVICHTWQRSSHSRLEENRYKEQDMFAQWCVNSCLWCWRLWEIPWWQVTRHRAKHRSQVSNFLLTSGSTALSGSDN